MTNTEKIKMQAEQNEEYIRAICKESQRSLALVANYDFDAADLESCIKTIKTMAWIFQEDVQAIRNCMAMNDALRIMANTIED